MIIINITAAEAVDRELVYIETEKARLEPGADPLACVGPQHEALSDLKMGFHLIST